MAFIKAVLWNLRLGTSMKISAALAALIALSMLAAASANASAVAVNYLVESFSYALYAVYVAIGLIPGGRGLVLELNIFSSYRSVYFAKVVAFMIALVFPSAVVAALGAALGIVEPWGALVKIATSASIFALSVAVNDVRAALLLLIVLYALAPSATLTLVTTALSRGPPTHAEMPLLAWAAYISPISVAMYKGVAPLLELYACSLVASVGVIAAGYYAFVRAEINPAD